VDTHISKEFHDVLPYSKFALRVPYAAMGQLPEVLSRLSDRTLRQVGFSSTNARIRTRFSPTEVFCSDAIRSTVAVSTSSKSSL
jgi:hypothetical protein